MLTHIIQNRQPGTCFFFENALPDFGVYCVEYCFFAKVELPMQVLNFRLNLNFNMLRGKKISCDFGFAAVISIYNKSND